MRRLVSAIAFGVFACVLGSTVALAVKPAAFGSAWVKHSNGTYVYPNSSEVVGSCDDGEHSCTYIVNFCDTAVIDGAEQFYLSFNSGTGFEWATTGTPRDMYRNKDADSAGVWDWGHPWSSNWWIKSNYTLNQIDWDLHLGQTFIGYIKLKHTASGENYITYVWADLDDCP